MDWFSFWFHAVHVIVQGVLHLLFAGRFTNKKLKIQYFAIYLLLFCTNTISAPLLRTGFLAIAAELLVLYAVIHFLLGSSRSLSLVTAILAVYVEQLSYGIVNSLQFLLFHLAIGHSLLLKLLVILASCFAFTLCICCYRLILKCFAMMGGCHEPYIWILLPPALFFFSVEIYLLRSSYGEVLVVPYPLETGKHLFLLILQMLGLTALFSALYVYRRTCEGFQVKAALTSLRQEVHAQKSYVVQAQARYEQTRAFRHDLTNHLSVLDGLLRVQDMYQAQIYLKKLNVAAGVLSFPVHTGNPVVDILLGDKLELARADGTKVETALILPGNGGVDDFDLCVIFANAMDNAILACKQMDGPGLINITGEQQGSFYMLEFENTCTSEPEQPMGTGLSNIQAVAEKYRGVMTIEKVPSLFRLNVLLNISIQPGSSSRQNP